MDIHKPKPIHNWREFLKELGTIALGVGIALAAEQGVEWWHWRAQVAQARATIASEMARNISYGIERLRGAECLQSRLREIEKILEESDRSGTLPPLGQFGSAPLVPWSSGAWESVVASQTATHFPRQELASLSLTYARVQRVENWNRQETEEWSTLARLSGPARRFNLALGADWQTALGLAMTHNVAITTSSVRFIQDIQKQNLPFTEEEQRLMAEAKTAPMDFTCGPLSAVPGAGGALLSPARLHLFEDVLKRLPYGMK